MASLGYAIAFHIINSIGAAINGTILVFFACSRTCLNLPSRAYFNLALTDFLLSIHACILALAQQVATEEEIRRVICKVRGFLFPLFLYLNYLSVVPLTYDRYVAVFSPIRYKHKSHKKHINMVILLVWVIAVFFEVFRTIDNLLENHGLVFNTNTNNSIRTCPIKTSKTKTQILSITTSLLFAFAPLCYNIIVYTAICVHLSKLRAVHRTRTRALTLRAFLICAMFTVSWLPYVLLVDILQREGGTGWWNLFLYVNCIGDPILYLFSCRSLTRRIHVTRVPAKGIKAGTITNSLYANTFLNTATPYGGWFRSR